MLQAGRPRVLFPKRSWDYVIWPNPSSRTVALGSTQPITEISKALPARKTNKLTAVCEPIV
jgi:hypothetical protein